MVYRSKTIGDLLTMKLFRYTFLTFKFSSFCGLAIEPQGEEFLKSKYYIENVIPGTRSSILFNLYLMLFYDITLKYQHSY